MKTEQDWGIYKQVNRLIRSGYDRKKLADILEMLSWSPENSPRPVSEVLERLDEIVSDASAVVRVRNDNTDELEPVLCRNLDKSLGLMDMDPQVALPRHMFDMERPDITQRAWYHRQMRQAPCSGSYLAMPLEWRDFSLGRVSFFKRVERRFTHVEVLGLLILTDEIAAAIGRLGLVRYAQGS